MGKRIQKILLREIGKEVLNLGYAGENEHTEITINCVEVYADYPDATVQMVVKPPVGDQYLAVVSYTAGLLKWDVTASDVAASGGGSYQLIFEDGGVEIFRSAIGKTQIMASLDGSTGDAPTPQETWAEAMSGKIAELVDAAIGTGLEEQISSAIDTKLAGNIIYVSKNQYIQQTKTLAPGECYTLSSSFSVLSQGYTFIGIMNAYAASGGEQVLPINSIATVGHFVKNNSVYVTLMNVSSSSITFDQYKWEALFAKNVQRG